MANRYYNQAQYTAERAPVTLFGTLTVGAAGAVSAVKGYGIKSITKVTGDGKYEVVLSDKFSRCLEVSLQVVHSSISAVAALQVLNTPAQLQTAITGGTAFVVQLIDKDGAAVNAESGAMVMLQVVASNSSVDAGKGV
jgi:hypothetical protein